MANRKWDEDRKRLRELLKELRIKQGMTQVQLSQALEKPQSYVSKYENGERRLDYVEVCEICSLLEISMNEFNQIYTNENQSTN